MFYNKLPELIISRVIERVLASSAKYIGYFWLLND